MSNEKRPRERIEDAENRAAAPCCAGASRSPQSGEEARTGCPMSGKCGDMVAGMRGGLGLIPAFVGLVLLALAAAIILEPQVLVWFVAAVIGLVGLAIIVVTFLLRRALPAGGGVR